MSYFPFIASYILNLNQLQWRYPYSPFILLSTSLPKQSLSCFSHILNTLHINSVTPRKRLIITFWYETYKIMSSPLSWRHTSSQLYENVHKCLNSDRQTKLMSFIIKKLHFWHGICYRAGRKQQNEYINEILYEYEETPHNDALLDRDGSIDECTEY